MHEPGSLKTRRHLVVWMLLNRCSFPAELPFGLVRPAAARFCKVKRTTPCRSLRDGRRCPPMFGISDARLAVQRCTSMTYLQGNVRPLSMTPPMPSALWRTQALSSRFFSSSLGFHEARISTPYTCLSMTTTLRLNLRLLLSTLFSLIRTHSKFSGTINKLPIRTLASLPS